MAETIEFRPGYEVFGCFETPVGWMCLTAHVEANGNCLMLQNLDFKPLHTAHLQIGVGRVLAIAKDLQAEARRQGYTTLIIEGFRTSGRNPHRPILYRRRVEES